MIKNIYTSSLSLILLLLLAGFNTQAQNWLWAQAPQGGIQGFGNDVATDSKGNAYEAGYFRGSHIQFGTYTLNGDTSYLAYNMFLTKYDSTGNVLWAATSVFDTASPYYLVYGYNVTTDVNDNAIFTGTYYSTQITIGGYTYKQGTTIDNRLFVVKYSPGGTVLWVKQAGGNAVSTRVATDKAGEIYVTGNYNSAIMTFGTLTLTNVKGNDGFIVKYDSLGNVKWARDIPNNLNSTYGLVTDLSYNIYCTGQFQDSITLGTNILTDARGTNFFLAKYDSAGAVLWATDASKAAGAAGVSVSTDAPGNVYLTGFYTDTLEVGSLVFPRKNLNGEYSFILKYSPAGNIIWGKSFTTGQPWVISTSSITANSFICGEIEKDSVYRFPATVNFDTITVTVPTNGITPMFVAEVDSAGNFICATALGRGGEGNSSVAADNTGTAYVAGDFFGTPFTIGNYSLTFDTTGPLGTSSQQIFIARYSCAAPNGINTVYNPQAMFNIFPNPASDNLYITTDGKEGMIMITITNIVGQTVYESNVASTYFEIPVSNLSSGIYLVRLQTADGDGVRKWVKE